MRIIKENHFGISTILSFALIPLSGFATDIYIPSLPAMAGDLHVTASAIQLSLVFFLVSYGLSQLFVGSLLDSFGRYRLGLAALACFGIASFVIAITNNIYLIYAMRIVHGITTALIVVGKRAYFVDIFSGERLKHFTSLFSIIWATAPIIAPFLGGYLQTYFGWESNFYFLGFFTVAIGGLEILYGGESLKTFHKFSFSSIAAVYSKMVKTTDFTLGIIVLALAYSMLIIFGMSSPFIIEHVFHMSPVISGYCALVSGISLMAGGIVNKMLAKAEFFKKMQIANLFQVFFAVLMIASVGYVSNIYSLMVFVIVIHFISGFIFNSFFSYCLGRFSNNAGIASGIIGGGLYVSTSVFSYGSVNAILVKDQAHLGLCYFILALLMAFVLFMSKRIAIKVS
ncbi:MAG TPA: MFS transporter [Flavobacterium sp.]|nr:MFS transporter [Flavobacterium sp.]